MKTHDIAALSAKILLSYYVDNNSAPFLNACHDDVVLVGPSYGHLIRSKAKLLAMVREGRDDPKFQVHDLMVTTLPTPGPDVCEVVMTFLVDSTWPSGNTNRVNQHIHFTWVDCQHTPRILLCNVANAIAYTGPSDVYLLRYGAIYDGQSQAQASSGTARRICLRGLNRTAMYFNCSDIIYIESKGTHSLLHTEDGAHESVETLSSIAQRHGDLFVRCHASYLVNPAFVRDVTRCKVTLQDGSELPIPEKKYTAVKRELAERMG